MQQVRPLAEDLQNILTRELIALKSVAETEVDPLQEKWVKAAILKNLPKKIVTNLSLQLKTAKTVEAMQNLINIYLHDHKTGLPKGQTGPMLCLAEDETTQTYAMAAAAANKTPDNISPNNPDKIKDPEESREEDLDAIKGGKKGQGKGKGYGACWHCGQWGHPRRECPELLKLPGGNVAALKGPGGYGGKGKAKKGKSKKGQGKGNCWWSYGNSAGQWAGRSFNDLGSDDYYDAWGRDDH